MIYAFCVSKEKLKKIVKEGLLFIAQIAFSKLQFGAIFPMGVSFAFVRIFFGGNLFVVAFEYLLSNLFLVLDFYLFLCVCFEIVVFSLYYFFKSTIKFKKKKLCLFLFIILSSMLKLYFSVLGSFAYLNYFLELALKCVSLAYLIKTYSVFQKKFIFLKCSNLDYLLFSVFAVLFVLGIFKYEFLAKFLGLTIFVFAVLVTSRFLPTDKFLIFSASMSLCFGIIFASPKLVILSMFGILMLVFISRIQKYLFLSVSMMLMFVICKVTNALTLSNIISLSSGLLLVSFIPQRMINKLTEIFEDKNLNIIRENLWQEKERDVKQNLMLMSKTLEKMRDDFKFLMVGKIDRKYASSELAKDIMCRVCGGCENRKICSNSIIDKERNLSEYIFRAVSAGEIVGDELSVGFRTYCNKTSIIVREINLRAKQFMEFEANIKTEDESKLLISSELENFANLFQNFAKNIEKSPKINKNLSSLAKEVLENCMIEVADIGVFESKNGIEKIDVVAENNVMMRKELVLALSGMTKRNLQIKKLKHLDYSGMSLVSFVIANELKAEFAVSASSKEAVSGDNSLITKLDENRYFVAIADGMGHGKLAGKTSNMILELIKNMVVIGIDLEIIVDCVNRLVLPVGLENFSTLDAVIVDLRLNKCTFIKLGSSVSLIKHKERTEVVSCDSLPVGIVQNLKPTIITKNIQDGDIVVLASDGVVDSFGEIENYKYFINDQKIMNLQRFTDNVIFELNLQPNKHRDDMSIIALKLLKNSIK